MDNRRSFFEKYAKDKGFSPRDPNYWYFVSVKDLLQEKVNKFPHLKILIYVLQRAQSVIAHSPKKDLALGIMEAFPDIGLMRNKFATGLFYFL